MSGIGWNGPIRPGRRFGWRCTTVDGGRFLNGKSFLRKLVLLLIVPLALSSLSGCATVPTAKGDWEAWGGQLTGGVDGDLQMSFSRHDEGDGIHFITGRFQGDIEGVHGGYGRGTIEGAIEGKFKDGIFDLRLSGQARLSEGAAPIHGKMIGTLSHTTAFGTWHMLARSSENSHRLAGEWRVEKLETEPGGNRP